MRVSFVQALVAGKTCPIRPQWVDVRDNIRGNQPNALFHVYSSLLATKLSRVKILYLFRLCFLLADRGVFSTDHRSDWRFFDYPLEFHALIVCFDYPAIVCFDYPHCVFLRYDGANNRTSRESLIQVSIQDQASEVNNLSHKEFMNDNHLTLVEQLLIIYVYPVGTLQRCHRKGRPNCIIHSRYVWL